MRIGVMQIKLYAPSVHSLKEKRMIVKSLITKIRNKFNVSIVEVEEQDMHQVIVISMSVVLSNKMQPDMVWDQILNFIEDNTEAQITNVYREIR